MRSKTVWFGEYRDVVFEINNFDLHEKKDAWTFYLHLPWDGFPIELHKDLKPFEYYTAHGSRIENGYGHVLDKLEWHHGMTFIEYQRKEPFDYIKCGCDYQHYWDEGACYSENWIRNDAHKCIDSLFAVIPNFKTASLLWEDHRSRFPRDGSGYFDKFGNKMPESELP